MPELPEVETIRRTLAPRVVGRTITGVRVLSPKFVVGAGPEKFTEAVAGARIEGLDRRGKFLIVHLEYPKRARAPSPRGGEEARDGPAPGGGDIIVHLKMAGQLVWCTPRADLGPTRQRHTHVVFSLDDGCELRYVDTRHFGRLYFTGGDPADPALRRALETLARLGPEPCQGGLDWPTFREMLASRKARIKPLLLDQSFVSGLGNIYTDECLFRAGVHPLRRASSLSEAEVRALHRAMCEVIGEAIELRGTSVRDYVDGEGREGSYAGRLRVYGRAGEACPRCGARIARTVVGGRGTYFCPRCQRFDEEPARSRTDV